MSYIDIERIARLSEADKSVPLYQKIIKLGEESGEVAEAFALLDNDISTKNAKEVIEESCDVINVAVDIINAVNKIDPKIGYVDLNDNIAHHLDLETNAIALYQDINSLQSECGKVAQYFLRFDGAKNVSKSADTGLEYLLIQTFEVIKAANLIIEVIVDGFDSLDMDFVEEMFTRKLDKWEYKQKNY